ncbi:left-right determination factor 1-like [Vulpes vulpes]|uniref:Left-right determination factor 1-like n=1 Tax=Vulpes vulpes TaxID=9627 RepID=A0ABM4YHQ4_VULVU
MALALRGVLSPEVGSPARFLVNSFSCMTYTVHTEEWGVEAGANAAGPPPPPQVPPHGPPEHRARCSSRQTGLVLHTGALVVAAAAVLRLFQEPVPRAALRRLERLSPHSARARVTIEWLQVRDDGPNRTSLVDSRLVSLHESGWKAFDVTEAVTFWQQLSRPRQPLLLQVSVQREHLGPPASGAHRLVRFASQGPTGAGQGEPRLELHTLDLGTYGAQGDCDPEVPVTQAARCCRQEVYIDLRGMKWAENWVLEPLGFLAYECVGTCQQPPRPLPFEWPLLGPRQCVPSETTSLPMIVTVKEGGRPRPRVVSLPNMRVQKCSCSWDGMPVPRKLEP